MDHLSLTVAGMTCTGCEHRISTALRRLDGVRQVRADHRTGSVAVEYDPSAVGEAAITRRLADAGYDTIHEEAPR